MIRYLRQFQNQNFSRLWWAQLISQFGDRIYQMALIGLIAERAPGSAIQLAKLMAFTVIPVFLIGPVAGVYVDRWDRRTTLFVCDFLRGLLVLAMPFIFIHRDSMVPIYIIVFLVFCLSRFYVPAKMSILPDLVSSENLLMANSLMTTTGMLAFVGGCAAGGFLVDYFGARGGFLIDAFTFFASGMLLLTIVPARLKINRAKFLEQGREVFGVIRKSVTQEMKEGLQYLVSHKEIRFIINMLFILFAAAGAIYVVIIVFVQQSFQSVTKDLSILAVLLGVGLFIGVMIHGRWGHHIPWYKVIFFCLAGGGLMLMVFAVTVDRYPRLAIASILSVALGIIVGPIFIAANTVAQEFSKEQMRGKVFSALEVVIHFAFLTAMLASSFLAEYVSRVLILAGVGAVLAVIGAAGFIGYKGDLAISREKGHN